MRAALRTLVALVLAIYFLPLMAAPAHAQEPIEVVGTADFRNPPTLEPGSYLDTIVTGETVWYAIVYTNGTPYRFEVSLPDGVAEEGTTVSASFVGPTLGTVGDRSTVVEGSGASYANAHTNVWYVTVTLETTGRLGVEHRIQLDVEGAEATGFGDCSRISTCTLDDELAVLDTESAEVETDLAEVLAMDTADVVQREIESLQGQLETADTLQVGADAALARAEARMADLCAPETTCETFPDQGSKTPIWAWMLGLAVLAIGANKIRKPKPPPPQRQVARPASPKIA